MPVLKHRDYCTTEPVRMSMASLILVMGLAACSKEAEKQPPRPLSSSAQILVNPPSESSEAVLLHTVDSATEFAAALESLDPEIIEPEVRIVEDNRSLTAKADPSAPVVNIVAPVVASVPLKEDWGGIILVPDMDRMSRGFTSRVTLTRIEAHPLHDDHFRVWVRIRNDSDKDISVDVACNFTSLTEEPKETAFIPVQIPTSGSANAYFISPITDARRSLLHYFGTLASTPIEVGYALNVGFSLQALHWQVGRRYLPPHCGFSDRSILPGEGYRL